MGIADRQHLPYVLAVLPLVGAFVVLSFALFSVWAGQQFFPSF